MQELQLPSTITPIEHDLLEANKVRLMIKRDDLIHPEISGNKWRKLKYNFKAAEQQGKKTLLTFGGAYSNHIAAVAAAGNMFDFATKAIVRGEEPQNLNPTLQLAKEHGMELEFVSRQEYHKVKNASNSNDKYYVVPEGGANELGVEGCEEILTESTVDFDIVCLPCGTGTTLAGIANGLKNDQQAFGFPAIKGGDYLLETIEQYVSPGQMSNVALHTQYHFGGFAKHTPALISFIKEFKIKHHILLDPIYTGKMLFGIFDMLQQGYFKPNTTVLAIHTGGLQGWKGFEQRFGIVI